MIKLHNSPKNKEKFARLLGFCKEILSICSDLNIDPILNASLAVFAYTKNLNMNVNDIDLLVPETRFSEIITILEERGIKYELKAWHVLRIIKDDLKIELDSIDYWPKVWEVDSMKDCDTLQVDDLKIKIISLENLKQTYRMGVKKSESRAKDYKAKLEILNG